MSISPFYCGFGCWLVSRSEHLCDRYLLAPRWHRHHQHPSLIIYHLSSVLHPPNIIFHQTVSNIITVSRQSPTIICYYLSIVHHRLPFITTTTITPSVKRFEPLCVWLRQVMQAGGGWGKLLEDRPPSAVLLEAQKFVRERLEKKWLPLFLAIDSFLERQKPKMRVDDVVDDVLIQKRRRSMAVWKVRSLYLRSLFLLNLVIFFFFKIFSERYSSNVVVYYQNINKKGENLYPGEFIKSMCTPVVLYTCITAGWPAWFSNSSHDNVVRKYANMCKCKYLEASLWQHVKDHEQLCVTWHVSSRHSYRLTSSSVFTAPIHLLKCK